MAPEVSCTHCKFDCHGKLGHYRATRLVCHVVAIRHDDRCDSNERVAFAPLLINVSGAVKPAQQSQGRVICEIDLTEAKLPLFKQDQAPVWALCYSSRVHIGSINESSGSLVHGNVWLARDTNRYTTAVAGETRNPRPRALTARQMRFASI